MRSAVAVASVVALATLLAACRDAPTPRPPGAEVGDVRGGAVAIEAYGCGACHTIPGIPDADSLVGPPLTSWSDRSFIAGTLPNNQANLIAWIIQPDAIRPGTAMPDLDVDPGDAKDIAAYLLDLE